jgi:hypothetical protein
MKVDRPIIWRVYGAKTCLTVSCGRYGTQVLNRKPMSPLLGAGHLDREKLSVPDLQIETTRLRT